MTSGLDETADAGTQNATVALAPGSQLGKYRLDRVLGEGGMGVVWAAHDPDLDRAVAIKVLRYAEASQQLRQRLLREARAMAKLKHPNVLTVYEVGTVGDRDYIAMEIVDGMSLDAWLALAPTADEIWSAVLAAGRGLAAAHEAGVVHRDFKPHNVLRSRGGRILVTDFGLARGMLAEDASASLAEGFTLDATVTPFGATLEAPRQSPPASAAHAASADSLLASPLTQTGALVGTPAYMAPEQYRGALPDPRTDQFAFCVTAWQALTGERPFKGTTLDEMRAAASRGVAHVQTTLPGEVRAVLARGLDPVAARRWPSLEVLLDELGRAAAAPARRRRRIGTLAAIAAALALAATMFFGNRSGSRARTGCDEPDQQFVEAWSPAVRTVLARNANETTLARLAEPLDRYRERWIESYAKACRGRPAKIAQQRIACLEGVRDHVAAITTMLEEVDARVIGGFDARDALPPLASCETASPLAPPAVPKDQPRRSKILHVLGRALALRSVAPQQIGPTTDALLAEGTPLRWEPLTAFVLVAAAGQYARTDQPALARTTYARALASLPAQPELRNVRVEGSAYLGLLETSLTELENPRAAPPPGIIDPKTKAAPLHGELAVRLTKATNAAGADPLLVGARSLLAAVAYAQAAQWNRYPAGYDEALRLIADARKQFDLIDDVERAAYVASIEASIYMQRGDDRALDDAFFAARRAQDALEAAHRPRMPQLDEVLATVAFARRAYSELYRLQQGDRREPPALPTQVVKGHVTGDNAGSAVVVAWPGDLVGHARSIVMDSRVLAGEVVRVERDGSFAIHANRDWLIMAETQDARSTPRAIAASGTGALALDLQPTVTISGQVQGKNWFGVKAFARYSVGGHSWTMQAPIDKDGAFDLRGLPPGAHVYGTQGAAGTGERTIIAGANPKQIAWSYGQALELIVRGIPSGEAWVIRGDHKLATREQLAALVATAADVAVSGLSPVGANNTDAGRELYRPGDRHAVITGNYDGQVYTACVAATSGGAFACKPVTVEKTVGIEYPDGRFGAGVTPILFEL